MGLSLEKLEDLTTLTSGYFKYWQIINEDFAMADLEEYSVQVVLEDCVNWQRCMADMSSRIPGLRIA